jgi:hypothetical protein
LRYLTSVGTFVLVATVAALLAYPAGAVIPQTTLCGTISAGGAKWLVQGTGTPCKAAVAGVKLFGAAHLKYHPGQMIMNWAGGPKGFICSVTFAFNGHVQEGSCSHHGGSFLWRRIGA